MVTANQVVNDQRFVMLRGVTPGLTRLFLTAVGENQAEVFEVIVQKDIELLRNILAREARHILDRLGRNRASSDGLDQRRT